MNRDLIKNERPPNWEDLKVFFPILEEMEKANAPIAVVFTYAPYLYVPGGQQLRPDVFMHEHIHLKQQGKTPATWWTQYMTDSDFRLSQELEAYGAQLAMFNHAPNRVFEFYKDALAQELSSEIYGNIISFGDAASKIRKIAKSITHDIQATATESEE